MARYFDIPKRWMPDFDEDTDTLIVGKSDRVHVLRNLIENGKPGDLVEVHPDRVDFWLALPDYVTLRTCPDGEEIRKRLTPWDWGCKLKGVPSQYRKKKPSEKSKFYQPWVEAYIAGALVTAAARERDRHHAAVTDEPIPLDKMRAAPRLALDTETDGIKGSKPMPTRDPILGVSIGWGEFTRCTKCGIIKSDEERGATANNIPGRLPGMQQDVREDNLPHLQEEGSGPLLHTSVPDAVAMEDREAPPKAEASADGASQGLSRGSVGQSDGDLAPIGDAKPSGQKAGDLGDCAPQEQEHIGQPAGEPGATLPMDAPGPDSVPSLSQNLSDPVGCSHSWETTGPGECWIPAAMFEDKRFFTALVKILTGMDKELIGHHAKFDEIIMHRLGVLDFKFDHDTMLLSYMHGGRYPAGLKKLIYQLRGTLAQELKPLINRYGRVSNIPKATLIPYAKADARNTYDAMEDLEKLPTNPMYGDLEMPVSRLLCQMEERGWHVDNERLNQVESDLEATMARETEELAPYGITSPTKNQEVAQFFIDEGFSLSRTQQGWCVDKDALRGIDHPAVEHVLAYREAHKRATNWVRAMRRTQDDNGYIHPSWKQIPVSGRLSCSNPNAQNYTYDLRSCMVPDPGHVLMAADMSQFELRIMAKAANEPTLIQEYLDGIDVHDLNQRVLHLPTRRAAKDTMYGIGYGQGDVALANGLTKKGQPTTIPEARRFMASIYEKYGRLKPWKKEVLAECRRTSVSQTLAGRERWVPEVLFDDQHIRGHAERAAVNHVIQGTAGDLMKMGMLILEEYLPQHGARQLGQIHDEFVISTPNPFATYDALMMVMAEFRVWLDPVPVEIDIMVDYHWGMKG